MRRLALVRRLALAAGLCLAATAALADVTGQVCVIDGNQMAVNGRRAYGRCTGGTVVRLFGVDAPDLAQLCRDPSGREWMCGRAAAANLLEMVKNRTVTCRGNGSDAQNRVLAVCFVADIDVGREMVKQGWALAHSRESNQYQDVEGQAHDNRAGLWIGTFDIPTEWRARHGAAP